MKPETIVIKYGGNAMVDSNVRERMLDQVAMCYRSGYRVVLTHGGGPYIQALLDDVGLESQFIGGHRETTDETIRYVQMALLGETNPSLVRALNKRGVPAVGLSGCDFNLIRAKKRYHQENGTNVDIGWVGEVEEIKAEWLADLLDDKMMPVIACVATDGNGQVYNVNADLVGGHIAASLQASQYIVMTDVDGLLTDVKNPNSLITEISLDQLISLRGSVIKGGMIPKIESCEVALRKGARTARIINGMKPEHLPGILADKIKMGTKITN